MQKRFSAIPVTQSFFVAGVSYIKTSSTEAVALDTFYPIHFDGDILVFDSKQEKE